MAEPTSFHEQYRLQQVRDAVDLLTDLGEVWFYPGNNGDLGSLMVGDLHVASVRTYTERHDG